MKNKQYMNKYLLLLVLFLGMQSGIAQVRLTQNPADRLLEQAVQKMQVADYEGANEIFRDILNTEATYPRRDALLLCRDTLYDQAVLQ